MEFVGFTFGATELFAGLHLVAMDIAFILAVHIRIGHFGEDYLYCLLYPHSLAV